jgi:hypothetical protein
MSGVPLLTSDKRVLSKVGETPAEGLSTAGYEYRSASPKEACLVVGHRRNKQGAIKEKVPHFAACFGN